MKAYPHFPKRRLWDLNTLWDFTFRDDLALEAVVPSELVYNDRLPVPGAFDAFPAYAGKRGLGIYRCFADVPTGVPALLRMGGAAMSSRTFVDGVALGAHIGAYTPFTVVLPPAAVARREIVVATDNRYDYARCPLHENYFDFYNYGGLIRQVWLETLPPNPIESTHVLVEDVASGTVTVQVVWSRETATLRFRFDDEPFADASLTKTGDRTASFHAAVAHAKAWSLDAPHLHTLTLDTGADAIVVRFGLRRVTAADGQILLNGTPVKLLGFCRHEAHPQFGPATPDSLLVGDLQRIKAMGCNFVRGSHYRQDPRLLDLCDEMGIAVFSESLGWGQSAVRCNEEHFAAAQLEQTGVMVQEDFNHPSILIWGFLNEGASDNEEARPLYTALFERVRALDSSRLVAYASNRGLNDRFLSEADVICLNLYPGWYSANVDDENPLDEAPAAIRRVLDGLARRGWSDKPFMISEIGAGALYGFRDDHNGYWTENYQAELLRRVCEYVRAESRVAGLAIWQFCDTRTYAGGRALSRPRAFNNKGVFDEYRRPKAAAAVVAGIFASLPSPME